MATVDDLFTCAICLDRFKSPRRLPCHHVYCLQCLRGLVKDITYRRVLITCPECRRDHVVPNKRIENFPVDGRLEQLMEKMAKLMPEPDDYLRDISALSKCDHSQPACRECRTNRALLLETLLQESRQFRADNFTENQKRTRQKQKVRLHGYIKNLQALRIKVVNEMEDMIEELKKRKLTLLSRVEEEETLIVEDLSKLDQADTISAELESLLVDLVDKVHLTETLVSLRGKLSDQKELMTSLQNVDQNTKLLDTKFNSDELRKMIDNYGEFFTVVDYQKDFTIATTLDGSESGNEFLRTHIQNHIYRIFLRREFTVSGSGNLFSQPWGLTVCPFTDNVYVTDDTSVRVYNSDGEYLRHIVTNDRPTGLAIDSNQRVIVASYKENKVNIYIENNVNIYNHDLKLMKSFGSKGDKNGEFNGPLDVACDRNDNIYVVDTVNSCIQVFTPDGTFLSVIGRGIFQRPLCLQINKRQEILVTDCTLGQIVIFTKDGTHIKTITGEGDNKLNGPCGICLDDRNRIFVADLSSKKIQVYNDDGTHHSTISQPADAMTSMCCLAVTKSGVIFITDYDGNKIHRIVSVQS